MAILTNDEIFEIAEALIVSGIDTGVLRGVLFQGIDPMFKMSIPSGLPPGAQVAADLGFMNMAERLANGDVPLQIYLGNAAFLLAAAPAQQSIIKTWKAAVMQRAYGTPRVDITKVPETNEAIIH